MNADEPQSSPEKGLGDSDGESTATSTQSTDGGESGGIQAEGSGPEVELPYDDDELEADSLMGELWLFIKEEKKWWMPPIIAALLLLVLLFSIGNSGGAPFIYTLF